MVSDRDGIAFQHRRLDAFLEDVFQALEKGDRRQCETAAFRFQGALHAHFDVEAQVIFPANRGRRPDLAGQFDDLEHDHVQLLVQLESICMSVFASQAPELLEALAAFRQAFGQHERLEEELLERAQDPRKPEPRSRDPL